jgi:histidinol dehydrogenase
MSQLVKIMGPGEFTKRKRAGMQTEIFSRAEAIMDDVAKRGMDALCEYSRKFDGFELDSGNILVSQEEIESAESLLDETQKRAIDEAFGRIYFVQEKIAKDALMECACKIGRCSVVLKPRAIGRVGIYVPGGVAPLPSSLLMAAIPARAAGVGEIIVCTPPRKEGISPAILYAAKKLGVRRIYRIGGAQAIAAIAYGVPGIMGKVDMACGPGNVYVAAAKQIASSRGLLRADLVAGPSEVLIIAGEGARADYAAADMLAQAEHGVNSPAVLLSASMEFAGEVEMELEKQLAALPKPENAEKSLRAYGAIVIVRSMAQAQEISNSYAPEHLEILGRDAQEIAKGISNAGAVFVNTCESFADYGMSGGNHILPTGGTARFLSGLSAYEFIVRTYIEVMDDSGQEELAELAGAFAEIEGLNAHANAARLRKKGGFK